MKGYKKMAKRKRVHTLKQIAAFNVSKCISSNDNVLRLDMSKLLYKLVALYLYKYSGDYMSLYH